jgi:hypothetical protein
VLSIFFFSFVLLIQMTNFSSSFTRFSRTVFLHGFLTRFSHPILQVDCTVGSALDMFGGDLMYSDVLDWHNVMQTTN